MVFQDYLQLFNAVDNELPLFQKMSLRFSLRQKRAQKFHKVGLVPHLKCSLNKLIKIFFFSKIHMQKIKNQKLPKSLSLQGSCQDWLPIYRKPVCEYCLKRISYKLPKLSYLIKYFTKCFSNFQSCLTLTNILQNIFRTSKNLLT